MLLALGRRIEYPEEHKMERDRLVAVVLALCVFGFHSLRSQSLSEPSANFRTIPQVYDPSRPYIPFRKSMGDHNVSPMSAQFRDWEVAGRELFARRI